jgi:hypothetical protein
VDGGDLTWLRHCWRPICGAVLDVAAERGARQGSGQLASGLAGSNIELEWPVHSARDLKIRFGKADPGESRYGGAVDVERATDLYAQGQTLRQIGAELGIHWSTVSQQLQGPASPCVAAVLTLTPPPRNRSLNFVIKASPGQR